MGTPTTPPTPSTGNTKLDGIVAIINLALGGLALIPGLGTGVAAAVQLEQALQRILTAGLAAYQAETGKPFNISLIPLEKPVE